MVCFLKQTNTQTTLSYVHCLVHTVGDKLYLVSWDKSAETLPASHDIKIEIHKLSPLQVNLRTFAVKQQFSYFIGRNLL